MGGKYNTSNPISFTLGNSFSQSLNVPCCPGTSDAVSYTHLDVYKRQAIVNAAVAYAGAKAKIANVGWCFGGGWSLRSGLQGGAHTVGTVMYYGMPVKDVEKLKTLSGDVLGLFATETRISKEVIEEFAANMKTAGKALEYKIFNGVHGFANPSNPKYDEALTKEAYGMSLNYLKARLGVK